jgi:malic enzyme
MQVNCDDPVKLVDMLVALEPTFGGVNLEDIKVRCEAGCLTRFDQV